MRALGSILAGGATLQWLLGLGGPGLIAVGLIDNSVVPIPGGMDLCVILLTSQHREWWPYYGAFATAGAVIGGYITFRLAKKGGKAEIEKKVGKRRSEKVYGKFEKGGFSTVFFGSMLPPAFPMVPVLMAAGIMQYPRKRFLAALTMGRAIRFFVVAYMGKLYGTAIVGWLGRYYRPFLYMLIGLGVLGGIGSFVYFRWYRPQRQNARQQNKSTSSRKAAQPHAAQFSVAGGSAFGPYAVVVSAKRDLSTGVEGVVSITPLAATESDVLPDSSSTLRPCRLCLRKPSTVR